MVIFKIKGKIGLIFYVNDVFINEIRLCNSYKNMNMFGGFYV